MVSTILSTVSLGIQIVVLFLIVSGYLLKRQKKYRHHGLVMLSALALHISSILIVMVPSLIAFFSATGAMNLANNLVILTMVHVSAGILAASLGVWIVSSWHLQESLLNCFKKKHIMDITLSLWLIAIGLGVVLYLIIIQAI